MQGSIDHCRFDQALIGNLERMLSKNPPVSSEKCLRRDNRGAGQEANARADCRGERGNHNSSR